MPKEAADFIISKPKLPLPISLERAILPGNKGNLRYSQMDEREVVRDTYFIAANWPLRAGEIRERRRSNEGQIAVMNAVYGGAFEPLE